MSDEKNRRFVSLLRGVAQLVARTAGGREVAGSSPVTPTIKIVEPFWLNNFCNWWQDLVLRHRRLVRHEVLALSCHPDHAKIRGMWQETKDGLYRQFTFQDFKAAFKFMQKVADLAEAQNHHPKWTNVYNKVEIWLSTHEAGDSITDKDRKLAEAIDEIT